MSKLNNLHAIDQRIEDLKKLKEKLKRQQAETFYRKLETLVADQFSPELILGMITEQLSSASPEQIKKWQTRGATFFRESTTKNRQRPTAAPSTPATKDQDHANTAA